jgi:hypothetical protein
MYQVQRDCERGKGKRCYGNDLGGTQIHSAATPRPYALMIASVIVAIKAVPDSSKSTAMNPRCDSMHQKIPSDQPRPAIAPAAASALSLYSFGIDLGTGIIPTTTSTK